MTRIYAASDAVEPVADTDAEQFGNIHLYGVIDGCAVTYDVADMTYDVAAGTILHNGSVVAVSAQMNAGTLVADGTNPRWATIYLDSTGTEGLVSGTAAADPSKPETGDNVEIAMVLIEAAQTIANNISVKLDKRAWSHSSPQLVYVNTSEIATTSTVSTEMLAATVNISADKPIRVTGLFSKAASSANAVSIGFGLNGTALVAPAASAAAIAASSATNQFEQGEFEIWVPPRAGAWGYTMRSLYTVRTATGAVVAAPTWGITGTLANIIPFATITAVNIYGQNHTSSNTLTIKDIRIYAG